MAERRTPKIQLGRRKTDIPVKALEQFKEEIKSHMVETIEAVVNEKLKAIDEKLDKQNKDIQPMLDWFRNINWGGRFIMKTLGVLAAIGGLWLLILKIFYTPKP